MIMNEDMNLSPIEVKGWVQRAIFIFLISLCTMGLIVVFSLVWREYFNAPPITIENQNEQHLGILCPGEKLKMVNKVTINDDVIVHYFFSTMDVDSNFNYPGTQKAYTDYLHPHPSTFIQTLSWTVPDLPSGEYARVFAVRKVFGSQDTVFVINNYTIDRERCLR